MKMKPMSQHYRDQQITAYFQTISVSERSDFIANLENHLLDLIALVSITDTVSGKTKDRGRIVYMKTHASYIKLCAIFGKIPRVFDAPSLKEESAYSLSSLTAVFVVGVEVNSLLAMIHEEIGKLHGKVVDAAKKEHILLDGWIMRHAKQGVSLIQAQSGAAVVV